MCKFQIIRSYGYRVMTWQILKISSVNQIFLFLEIDLPNYNSYIIVSFHLIVAKTSNFIQKDVENSMKF